MPMVRRSRAARGRDASPVTILVAVEMSRSRWIVGLPVPLADEVGCPAIEGGRARALRGRVDRRRGRVEPALGGAAEALCCHEAGREGLWLRRLVNAAGLRVRVIDPAGPLVSRKSERAKADRIDARAMIRARMAFERGEDPVLDAARIPSLEQEDERRRLRERRRLVTARTARTHRIQGLLVTRGVVGFDPRTRRAPMRPADLVTGDGRRLGPRLREEIRREIARLSRVMEPLAALEAERDAIAKRALALSSAREPEPEGDGGDAMTGASTRPKGVGANDASVLGREAFGRGLRARRERAAWSGLAPTPWSSGTGAREQGIAQSGPPAFRAPMFRAPMMPITGRWLHRQPGSERARGFERRTSGAMGRMRRIMAVARARRLRVALWRHATTGLVPRGAIMS